MRMQKNPDMKSIDTLKEKLQYRADGIFAGYDAALEERLHMTELDYEAGNVVVVFEKYTLYQDIKVIADRMGASVDVLNGLNKTLSDYMETGTYGEQYFCAAFDFGIGMSAPMAIEILQKIDCIKAVDLNAYVSADTEPDEIVSPSLGQNGDESGTATDTIEKPCLEPHGDETIVNLEEKQEMDSSQVKQDLSQTSNQQTSASVQKEKKNIRKGVVYTVSGLKYKVLNVKKKEVELVGSSKENIKKLNVKGTVWIEGE